MKTKSLLFLPVTIILILVYGFGGDAKWPGGSPGGYTGSPGDGKNCTQCHGGSASAALGWISSNIPDGGYIPGETYIITVSASGSGDKGFEVSPQDQNGNLLGTLAAGTGNHLVAGNTAVTQNNATTTNPAVWQFEWTAPETGTGDVTFYGAFTVNKPVTKLSTYTAHENTGVMIREPEEMNVSVFPNPAREKVQVRFKAYESKIIAVDLVALNGRTYPISRNIEVQPGENHIELPLPQDLSYGTYVLYISFEDSIIATKLLINQD